MAKRLTNNKSEPSARADRISPIHVLTIGVSRQLPSSGFLALAQCENAAVAIRDCFTDYSQLFADQTNIRSLTTKDSTVSRGAIFASIRELASATTSQDRLLLFFSGNGHRIDEELYLVPEDAYDSTDPSCLVDLDQLLKQLSKSQACQKIVMLDCCWSEPANSQEFWNNLARQTKDLIVLASGSDSQSAPATSPDSKLSQFTYHLKAALTGNVEALDAHLLTLESLYHFISARFNRGPRSRHQVPAPILASSITGPILIGDFTPTLQQSSLALNQSPIRAMDFSDSETLHVKTVLTSIRRSTYSAEYIADKVNDQLADYFEEDLGTTVARLKNGFDFPDDDIFVEGAGIRFPGGRYWLHFEAENGKSGLLMRHASFSDTWFAVPGSIAGILEALNLRPTEMKFEMTNVIDLKGVIPGIRAAGWTLTSQLDRKAEFSNKAFQLTIELDTVTFRGFLPAELLGKDETKQSKLASGVLMLVGKGRQ
jgi:hypothetical protein